MSLPTIENFRTAMLDGGARASLFEMNITYDDLMPADLRFFCRISEIPGVQQNFITQKFAGRELKFTGQKTFTNLTVTVLNDEGFQVRNAMEKWLERINSTTDNRSFLAGLQTDSVGGLWGTGQVTQFGKSGAAVRDYQFVGMFPVNLAPIALDWSNDAAIEEYTVEFAYQYWEVV